MIIGEIIEKLIYIKDHYGIQDLQELEAINEACNILDHRFNRFHESKQLKNEHITSIVWQNEDISAALQEKGFSTCKENVSKVFNYPGFPKYLQEKGVESGLEVIYNTISELKNDLLKVEE